MSDMGQNTSHRVSHQDVLLAALAMGVLLPVSAQYALAFWAVCWLATGNRWRDAWGLSGRGEGSASYRSRVRPVHVGVAIYLGLMLIAAIVAMGTSTYPASARETFREARHLILKQGMLWVIISSAFGAALARGWTPRRALLPLAVFCGLYVAYMIAQRWTGIDWIHGFSATLPAGRFSYDVWRPNGLMGHPLTLAFNAGLLAVTLAAVGFGGGVWWMCQGLAVLVVILTASRWPLGVTIGMLAVLLMSGLRRAWAWGTGGAIFLAAAVYCEGSLLRRTLEIFQNSASLAKRFPRVAFWEVHWRIFVDQPWAGVGIAAPDNALMDYYAASGYNDLQEKYSAHQIFLQTMADSGIIGLAGLLALLTGIGWAARRSRGIPRVSSRGLWATLVATCLFGLMQNNLRDTEYLYAVWFCVALAVARGVEAERA